jgi:radical S-adenosyl methionine domain-containing protein 2
MRTNTPIFPENPAATPHVKISEVDELTINWHVTEACNYRCQYCYAKWNDYPNPRELFHNRSHTRALLTELFRYFQPTNTSNPLREELSWKALRLNLAGGEPSILGDRLLEIAQAAREVGFELSIISNGSRLTRSMIKELAPHLTCLGISLDSANPTTNMEIGRALKSGKLIDLQELTANVHLARKINPLLTVKLNTVVNLLNVGEDLSGLVEEIRPQRWKILRMLPIVDASLAISDEEFAAFVQRHRAFQSVQCVEDNRDMCESYLMVDPFGRFFQNHPSLAGGYLYSDPILAVGVQAAFSKIAFNSASFQSRYTGELGGKQ